MKKLHCIIGILFTTSAYSATGANYLDDAANAWASVFGGGSGGAIADHMRAAYTSDQSAFRDMLSIIAYNETALSLFEANNHARTAFAMLDTPLPRRKNTETDKRVLIQATGGISASMSEYNATNNGDFKTHSTSTILQAQGFVSDGLTVGLAYSRTMTDTRGGRIYSDATTNGMTLFGKYLSRGGLFLNMGITGARTAWAIDKSVAGVENDSAYDTDMAAAALGGGLHISRGRLAFTPQVAVRYTYTGAGRHLDAAAQEFEKWWHNTITTGAGFTVGFDFPGDDFLVRPTISLGAAYDVISHGSTDINVRVISGQKYSIPLEIPDRTSLRAGLGLTMRGPSFSAGLNYRLDARSDYMAHMAMLDLKIAF